MRQFFLWICCLPLALKIYAQDLPVDKKATAETIHLYRRLKGLPQKGFLFGHQDDLAYGVGWKYVPGRSDVRDVTGDYPGLYGWELGRIELDHPVNLDSVPFDKMREFIRLAYRRGGVITISWHLNNPLTGGTAWQPAPGTVASILPALTEFGYNGLPDSSWWTGTFLPVLEKHRLAYVMAWRNAGNEAGGHHEFYVPFTGQASAPDFVRFHASPRVLFQQAATKEKFYQ